MRERLAVVLTLTALTVVGCGPGPDKGPGVEDCCEMSGQVPPGAAPAALAGGGVTTTVRAYLTDADGQPSELVGEAEVGDDGNYTISLAEAANGEWDILVVASADFGSGPEEIGQVVVAATAETDKEVYAAPITAESSLEVDLWQRGRAAIGGGSEDFHGDAPLWSFYLRNSVAPVYADLVEQTADPDASRNFLARGSVREQYALWLSLDALAGNDPDFGTKFRQLGDDIREVVARYDRLVHFGKARSDADRLAARDIQALVQTFTSQYLGANQNSGCEAMVALQTAAIVDILAGDPTGLFQSTGPEADLVRERWRQQTRHLLRAHGHGWNSAYQVLIPSAPPPAGDFPGFLDGGLANIEFATDPVNFWSGYETGARTDTVGKLATSEAAGDIVVDTQVDYDNMIQTPMVGALTTQLQNVGALAADSSAQAVQTQMSDLRAAYLTYIQTNFAQPNDPDEEATMACTAFMTTVNLAFWAGHSG